MATRPPVLGDAISCARNSRADVGELEGRGGPLAAWKPAVRNMSRTEPIITYGMCMLMSAPGRCCRPFEGPRRRVLPAPPIDRGSP